jgi:hypothetical protein
MKLGSGILKSSVQHLSDENFHFYNSLVLTDDLAFQQTYFRITPPNIPRIYNHDTATDDNMIYHYNTDRTYRITNLRK